jgi:isoleucyl-tRNA synthetase
MPPSVQHKSGFQPVENNAQFPRLEEEILQFWKERGIYDKSLERRQDAPRYVFYEGPPTANGMPHPGHCLTRAIKDLFPRYKTMRGFFCQRKAGWDTHGLPVEVEVGKELGIHSKEEIEAYGVEPFIHKCQQSVWRYMREWEQLTERLGFWVKLDEAYVTYHQSYIESVWWSLKNLFDRGLLYQGHKIVWWWAQGGTALSSGEVGQGYKTVMDPSVYVMFPLLEREKTALLVWTTTPWTLPSNQFAAVNRDIIYATVYDPEIDQYLILAKDLVSVISEKVKRELQIVAEQPGADLIGLRYRPPFDYFYQTLGDQTGQLKSGGQQHTAWRIAAADFVTTDSGTGAVHEAPPFGEVDYELLLAEQDRFVPGDGPGILCPVLPNGKFDERVSDFQGLWVKEADKPIIRALREQGRLYHQEQYQHEYPFCWRAERDPLIQYPRESWFIRTSQFKDQMLANNQTIQWLPGHIQGGRFGNFLESNIDWALSRERYWGTPLPIWICDQTGRGEAIASYQELLEKPGIAGTEAWEQAKASHPEISEDLKVHKPYIDYVTYDSPFAAGGRMRRVSEVIDCWYDSGAMPFAQWGYPHQGQAAFAEQFPADFISEAIDQTRGWFYSQLAISTLLFGQQPDLAGTSAVADSQLTLRHDYPHPFKNCIVLGLMLAEWYESKEGKTPTAGKACLTEEEARQAFGSGNYVSRVGKMSKQLKNYRSPREIFDNYGADALRWYFYANQPPWNSIIYSDRAIRESIPEFLLRLWNVYSFFVLYANIDQFAPDLQSPGQLRPEDLSQGKGYRPVKERGELDRWILSELHQTIESVVEAMDQYDNFNACGKLSAFVDALSNWYVRRSRDRFWAKDPDAAEKLDAYWTLYECLTTTVKLAAPFIPFLAETIWRNLATTASTAAPESVHLCDYPLPLESYIDRELSRRMNQLREIASLGLSARASQKLKVRQPLAGVTVILKSEHDLQWLIAHDDLLKTELNVLDVNYTTDAGQYVSYQIVPNFKLLGPRVGKLMPQVKQAVGQLDGNAVLTQLQSTGKYILAVADQSLELDDQDLEVRLQANPGWAAAQGPTAVVVLSTDLSPELIRAGLARDVNRLIQDRRKDLGLQRTDRIQVWLNCESAEIQTALRENLDYLMSETLAVSLELQSPVASIPGVELEVGQDRINLFVQRATD